MKKSTKIISLIMILVVIAGGLFAADKLGIKDKIWLSLNVDIVEDKNIGEAINVVNNEKNVSMWNLDYQNTIAKKIDKLNSKGKFTIDNPLIVYNPYGTNTCAVNTYFESPEAASVEYTVSVEDGSIDDFTRELYNDGENGLTKSHEYQIIGLIPNQTNMIALKLKDETGNVIGEHDFTITVGAMVSDTAPHMEITEGESTQPLSNGLYALLGHDKNYNANIYLYDNEGVIRSEFPLTGYRTDRILFIDDMMVYSYGLQKICMVDRLGQIQKKYNLENWEMHHDFVYDEVNDKLVILANEKAGDTIEDVVVSLDLKTGKTEEIIDFKDFMPEILDVAVEPEDGNTYGGDELDWIHFNSVQIVDGKDMILSSREMSSIIKVNDVYTKPVIESIISDESQWENTPFSELVYDKVGDFVSQAGQHTVTYETDEALEEGQYYLYLYNNNYIGARTRPDFDWSAYKGAGNYKNGEKSMFYQYLVDTKAKTYTLVEQIDLPYSSIVSSVQKVDGNVMTSSGMSNCYNEYDSNGKMIRQFNYSSEKYAYRVFKYSFDGFLFR